MASPFAYSDHAHTLMHTVAIIGPVFAGVVWFMGLAQYKKTVEGIPFFEQFVALAVFLKESAEKTSGYGRFVTRAIIFIGEFGSQWFLWTVAVGGIAYDHMFGNVATVMPGTTQYDLVFGAYAIGLVVTAAVLLSTPTVIIRPYDAPDTTINTDGFSLTFGDLIFGNLARKRSAFSARLCLFVAGFVYVRMLIPDYDVTASDRFAMCFFLGGMGLYCVVAFATALLSMHPRGLAGYDGGYTKSTIADAYEGMARAMFTTVVIWMGVFQIQTRNTDDFGRFASNGGMNHAERHTFAGLTIPLIAGLYILRAIWNMNISNYARVPSIGA